MDKGLTGCSKKPICCVSLILRRCGVPPSTPHSSGFREPCIWAFLSSLKEIIFLATAKPSGWGPIKESSKNGQRRSSLLVLCFESLILVCHIFLSTLASQFFRKGCGAPDPRRYNGDVCIEAGFSHKKRIPLPLSRFHLQKAQRRQ